MKKQIIFSLCISLFFVFFLILRQSEIPKVSKKIDYAFRYKGIESRETYFNEVFCDPRLKIDSNVIKIRRRTKISKGIDYNFLFEESSVQRGIDFMERYSNVLKMAWTKYGVEPRIIVAILRLETDFGDFLGNHLVVNALYTTCLAFPELSKDASAQLNCFLDLSKKFGWDPFSVKSSYAGAFGISQFMPRSFVYAVDGNGDGIIDLFNLEDAIMSSANFLKLNGWKNHSEAQKKALAKYNRGSYGKSILKYASLLDSRKRNFKNLAKN